LNDLSAQVDVADWQQELREMNAGTLPADALQQLVRVYVELEDVPRAISIGVDGFHKRGRGAVPLDPQASADLVVDLARLISREPSHLNDAVLLCREGLALQPTGVPGVRLWLVAADLALQFDHRDDCRDSLSAAQRLLAGSAPQEFAVRLALLAGDLARRRGDATGARTAYQARERTARDGAFSRSVEDLLRAGDLERAGTMLDDWGVQLPASRDDGAAALLRARWRLDSGFTDQAILECEDFVRIAPSDPYADQLLLLAARARHRLKHDDDATATLQRLIKEYPGSPLTTDARRLLQDGFPPEEAAPPKTTSPRRSSSNAEARPPN
jgi:tetratricopeptide (TPR) repeat protein